MSHIPNYRTNYQNSQQRAQQLRLTGLSAFQKILELTLPVDGSRELWLKLGHNKFIVGNYSPNGDFEAWHTKGSGKDRVRTRLIRSCWSYVSNWAKNNDGGVFFVPTQPQGCPIKEACAVSDDVAAELDEGTSEEQWQKISEFVEISGLEPAYVIHSGSKSYHPHWKATEHLPIAQTVYLRQLICIALNSDPAISNPHQPMRIAGFCRRDKGREQTLEYWNNSRYTYEQLVAGIRAYFAAKGIPFPEDISEERWRIYKRGRRDGQLDLSILTKPESELYPKPVYKSTTTVEPTYTGSIPLELALSRSNQEALRGVGRARNNTGLALAKDLIGCHSWLTSNGYAVEGEPYQLFISYCQSCTSGNGWNSREWESIWRSASVGNPTPARRDLTSFIHWYHWSNDGEYRERARAEWKSKNKSVDQLFTVDEYERRFTLPRIIKLVGNKIKFLKNKRLNAYGFSKEQIEKRAEIKCQPESYKKHKRVCAWSETESRFVFDSSTTGSGKSFDSGRVKPVDFNAEKIIYITNEPRNVTTKTLSIGWAICEGRHDGLVKDLHGKIRRAKGDKNEKIIAPANCSRTETIAALSLKNIQGANSSELICGGCPSYGLCKSGLRSKDVPTGYLGARASALASDRIIIHPSSLPSPLNFDYSKVVLLWDEWAVNFNNTKQIKVGKSDLEEIILHLTTLAPELIPSLLPLFTELGKIFSEKAPTRFGWSHGTLIERLKPASPDELNWEAIALATEPNLDALNPTKKYGCDIQELPKEVKKLMTDPDHQTAGRIEAETLKQWIIPFLKVLSGGTGYLSKSGGLLTITVPDPRLIDIAHAAQKNIFMDATGHLPDLAGLLGVRVDQIEHIAASPSNQGANTKYIQVAGLGRLGQQRGKHQERQTAAITKALQEKHPGIRKIAFKSFAQRNDLRWFIESRGANDAEKDTALILEGIPTPNLEALAAEFTCLYGRVPVPGTTKVKYHLELTNLQLPTSGSPYLKINESVDPQFRAFVRRKVLAALHQAIGRLRANRREGEELIIYILGDYPLDFPVELVKAIDITPEAATKIERFELALKGAIARLRAEGKKVTQTALSKITGYSQGYISRFKELLLLLLKDSSSKSNNSESPPPEVGWTAKQYLPLVVESELPEEIFNLDEVGCARDFLLLFELLPQKLKQNLIYWLLATQPDSIINQVGSVL